MAIVGATIFAGAYTIQIVEPQMVDSFVAALWWSLVTVSTVGYGDIFPTTTAGRTVAVILILIGVGVCGYVAGFMTNIYDRKMTVTDWTGSRTSWTDWPTILGLQIGLVSVVRLEWGSMTEDETLD